MTEAKAPGDNVVTPHFGRLTGMESMLTSPDWGNVSCGANILFQNILRTADPAANPESLFGLSVGQARDLYDTQKNHAGREDRLSVIRRGLEELDTAEIAALMHLENVHGHLNTAAHVIADRNRQNQLHGSDHFDREARRARLIQNIHDLKALGMGADKAFALVTNIKIWLTYTPHPTKDKSDGGDRLFRAQTALADDAAAAVREEGMETIIHDMVATPMTPRAKDTLQAETQDGLRAEDVYVEGMLDYMEDFQAALDAVYGAQVIDLTDPDVHLDVAPRDWHTGDADGKVVPASVLFGKRLRSAALAVRRNIEILTNPALPDRERPKFSFIVETLEEVELKLTELMDRIDEIEKMESTSADFQQAKDGFSNAFKTTAYKDRIYATGPDMTAAIIEDLRELSTAGDSSLELKTAALRVVLRHRQVGMGMGRQEVRHNGDDYNEIFDNLFAYLSAEHPEILAEAGLDEAKKISDLNPEGQAALLKRIMSKHTQDMRGWLLEANAEGWPREILERFKVVRQCFNHNRLGAAIIAEANPVSPVHQQVIAEAFGIKHLVHVALNEDEETIKNAAANLRVYSKVFGKSNLEARRVNNGNDHAPELFLCVMDPQSDSQKRRGLWIKPVQRETKGALIDLGLEFGAAVYDKLGTGLSPSRGGMSPKAVPRLFLNTLAGIGRLGKGDHTGLLKQMASFVSITVQGRDAGIRFGTKEQVYDTLSGIVEEIQAVCLAIDGRIEPDVVTPMPAHFTPLMRCVLKDIAQDCRDEFGLMRDRQSRYQLGTYRLDQYMEQASALKMAEMAGVGARKAARIETGKGKAANGVVKRPVTGLRAIGTDIASVNTETYFGGSYTLGRALQKIHEAYQRGELNRNDLKALWEDPFFMQQMFPNAMISLAMADYEHGFDKISPKTGDNRWTVGDVRHAEASGYQAMKKDETLAFHTVLTHDALVATAYLEALAITVETGVAGHGFDQSHEGIMSGLYQDDDTLAALKFGKRTLARFPDIEETQAHAKSDRLVRAVQHEMERRIDQGDIDLDDPDQRALLHHIACAKRTSGPMNMGVLMDRTGFGARPGQRPAFDLIREHMPQAAMRPENPDATARTAAQG